MYMNISYTYMLLSTLVSLIIVQDGINVQAGKILKINKRAGWNKAVQDGIFQKSIVKKTYRLEKFLKLIKRAGCNKAMQVGFFQKINKTCCMFI